MKWNFEILCHRVLEFRNSTSCKFRLNFKIYSDRILKSCAARPGKVPPLLDKSNF
ncbi:hypothetical protein [uncultured Campylobacter sp.]|uniref:hypothetical protein n=1 Tax=uncultured Campylobacter sp. TaxID=218934 RepID=UPI00262AAE91|nr:hypothetical protein [uncultured Campylobacter sp.]